MYGKPTPEEVLQRLFSAFTENSNQLVIIDRAIMRANLTNKSSSELSAYEFRLRREREEILDLIKNLLIKAPATSLKNEDLVVAKNQIDLISGI